MQAGPEVSLSLAVAIWCATFLAWISAFILLRAARGAHIGALTERAVAALLIAIFGSVYSFIVANGEVVRVMSTDDAVIVVRLAVIALMFIPVYWLYLYLSHRLGGRSQ